MSGTRLNGKLRIERKLGALAALLAPGKRRPQNKRRESEPLAVPAAEVPTGPATKAPLIPTKVREPPKTR